MTDIKNGAEQKGIGTDGDYDASGIKSGANQAGAGAATNELWVDTDDTTVKRGV